FIYGEPQAANGAVAALAPAPTSVAAAATPAATAAAAKGFTLIGKPINRDASQAALSPSLALGALNPDDPIYPWVAWAENTNGGKRQIFVSELVEDVFAPEGAALNIDSKADADGPSIGFAGAGQHVPWVAWSEPSASFGGLTQIFASKFIAASTKWQ